MDTTKLLQLAMELQELDKRKNLIMEDRKILRNRISELEKELNHLYSVEDEIKNRSVAIIKEIAIMVAPTISIEKRNGNDKLLFLKN